jgi:5-carboxymethyl-2-hydroxymuconate isomerase
MPHFIVEYTDNIKAAADIPGLLKKVNEVLIAQGGVFPIGAFCVGAISEASNVSMAFRVQGTAGLIGLVALILWWRRRPGEHVRR